MAFVFEFDPIHRIIGIRFSEDVTSDDLMYFYRMAALLVESFDPLSAIIDFSEVTTVNTDPQFMRELASLPPAMPHRERPRVVVAPSDKIFGFARLFEIHGETTRPSFHVVRSTREAWAIIGVHEPEFKPIAEAWESRPKKP